MPTSAGPDIVQDGLVLHLDAADRNSYLSGSTTWNDLSGNGNSGSLVNGPKYDSNFLGRIELDAVNDYISVSGCPTGNNYTLNLWFLISGPTTFANTGHRTFVASDRFRFQWDDNSSATSARGPFIDFNSTAGGSSAIYSNTLSPNDIFNKWHMTSVTSNGSVVRIYYDGLTSGTTINASRNYSSNGVSVIGIDNLSGIGGLDLLNVDGGRVFISQFTIYNRAFSASEILQNYNATKQRFGL
jgi:hypothetical protein